MTTRILVREGPRLHDRAKEWVAALGYEVVESGAADIVLAGLPGGEDAVRAANGAAVVVSLSGNLDDAPRRADEAGADAFVMRPYLKEALAGVLRATARLADVRRKLAAPAGDTDGHFDPTDPTTGLPRLEVWKALIATELKRAKRYGYSLAACMCAIDGAGPTDDVQTKVARILRAHVRDVDMPVLYGPGKFLVFLPYADLAGAELVGRRLSDVVQPIALSVGIAALRPGRPVSFARIVRDASSALRAAQLQGGGRVVVR
jgi:diguanylate cyclase (GGDEF)-like protein